MDQNYVAVALFQQALMQQQMMQQQITPPGLNQPGGNPEHQLSMPTPTSQQTSISTSQQHQQRMGLLGSLAGVAPVTASQAAQQAAAILPSGPASQPWEFQQHVVPAQNGGPAMISTLPLENGGPLGDMVTSMAGAQVLEPTGGASWTEH